MIFIGQTARWYHLGTPRAEAGTITTEPVAITDTLLKKVHPLNHFMQYQIDVRYVYSRGSFPFRNVQSDTLKRTPIFI